MSSECVKPFKIIDLRDSVTRIVCQIDNCCSSIKNTQKNSKNTEKLNIRMVVPRRCKCTAGAENMHTVDPAGEPPELLVDFLA